MKILHVTQGYTPAIGGTEFLIQKVSEELVRQFGDEVTVFTTNCFNGEAFANPGLPRMAAGWEEINQVKVRRFPVLARVSQLVRFPQRLFYKFRLPGYQKLQELASGPVIPGLSKAIQAYPADIIAASSFPLLHMFDALAAARKTGRPCVLHGGLHPHDTWSYQRPRIYQAIRQCDRYIANTEYEARYVQDRGADPEKVHIAGGGVDPELFAGIGRDQARQHLGLPGGPLIGFIGQLGRHKGVNTLLRAMPLVWNEFPEAHLLIAGGQTLFVPELEAVIRSWPAARQAKTFVRYNFPEEDKPYLFHAIDLLAYPSGFESFGIAFLEAWAAGKPVIGCERGAVPWVVDAGVNGLLVPYQDEKLLAQAILRLLASPEQASEMGRRGYQKMMQNYTWKVIAQKFREVYQLALLDGARTAS